MATDAPPPLVRADPLAPFAGAMRAASGPDVRLEAVGPQAMVSLRGRGGGQVAAAAAGAVGVALPTDPGRAARDGSRWALHLGPDEWLLLAADGEGTAIEAALRTARDDPGLAAVDVSHALTGFRLRGPAARGILARGCTLDLHERSWRPGDCGRTLLARTQMLLLQADDAPTFEIRVRNSCAPYAAAWLLDAMAGAAARRRIPLPPA